MDRRCVLSDMFSWRAPGGERRGRRVVVAEATLREGEGMRKSVARRRRKARDATPIIAVINTNDDLVLAIRSTLLDEGYLVIHAHIRDIKSGREDFPAFLATHEPQVVIFDIAIPYEDNWTFFQTLCRLPEARARRFVVTTVNKRAFERAVGPTDAVELIGGHADDLQPLVEIVRRLAPAPNRRKKE